MLHVRCWRVLVVVIKNSRLNDLTPNHSGGNVTQAEAFLQCLNLGDRWNFSILTTPKMIAQ